MPVKLLEAFDSVLKHYSQQPELTERLKEGWSDFENRYPEQARLLQQSLEDFLKEFMGEDLEDLARLTIPEMNVPTLPANMPLPVAQPVLAIPDGPAQVMAQLRQEWQTADENLQGDIMGFIIKIITKSKDPNQAKRPVPKNLPPEAALAPISAQPQPEAVAVNRPDRGAVDGKMPAAARWRYQPQPDSGPHHDYPEAFANSQVLPGDLKLIGARVRGRMHKHNGTPCDDWFEFGSSGTWTIIAVADGAGSKKFSRLGAKHACLGAVKYLKENLAQHELQKRAKWISQTFNRNVDGGYGVFDEPDLQFVQKHLHEAMRYAHSRLVALADKFKNEPSHTQVLGRPLELKDLSPTLLVAVHCNVPVNGSDFSFILTCQIGDGMAAAVFRTGALSLLARPDTGTFSGETEFLTSASKLQPDYLWRKTYPFFSPIRAFMIMTDGVADDYFPSKPEMLRLYGDLVINRIIGFNAQGLSDEKVLNYLHQYNLPDIEKLNWANLKIGGELIASNVNWPVLIYSIKNYADALGVPLEKVITTPELLMATKFLQPKPLEGVETPDERLCRWLDSYQVRGSADDRTLVVLYREVIA